jgi:hypothetical protein
MDPDAAWENLRDPVWDLGTRIESGYALLDWLEGGGFVPTDLLPYKRHGAIMEVKLWINSLEERAS